MPHHRRGRAWEPEEGAVPLGRPEAPVGAAAQEQAPLTDAGGHLVSPALGGPALEGRPLVTTWSGSRGKHLLSSLHPRLHASGR